MNIKQVFRILLTIGFFAPFSFAFSQGGDNVSIKITKNNVVIIDTVITNEMSSAEIESLIEELSGEENENEDVKKNVEVKVIRSGDMSELDSLLKIDQNTKNIEIEINDNQSGTEIEGNNKTINYEIKISKGEDKEGGEIGEETIVIEKEILKE